MTDFQAVGQQFIAHYYAQLTQNRAGLATLYNANSMLTYEGEQFMGVQQIGEKMGALPNLTFDNASAAIDLQPSANDGIFCLV